jgi:hypothetical protein
VLEGKLVLSYQVYNKQDEFPEHKSWRSVSSSTPVPISNILS